MEESVSQVIFDRHGLVMVDFAAGRGKGRQLEVSTDGCKIVRLTREDAVELYRAVQDWFNHTPPGEG